MATRTAGQQRMIDAVFILEAEFRVRGTTLVAWTTRNAITPTQVLAALSGTPGAVGEHVVATLADDLGVSPEALRELAA